MLIRRANPSDIPAMMRIRLAVRENMATREALASLGITERSLLDMLAKTHAAYCAETSGEVIGFSMADLDRGAIDALFVNPAHEGIGAGRKLLDAVTTELWNAGHLRISLCTEPGTRAWRFYVLNGWVEVGEAQRGDVRLDKSRPDDLQSSSSS